VELALRRIHRRRVSAIDLRAARARMNHLIDHFVDDDPDAEVTDAVDKYVQGFVSDLVADARHRHEATLRALDLLEARAHAYVVRLTGLHENETRALRHLDAAVAHALDRLGQPDTPSFNTLLPEQGRD